jgi:hypothetical protein
MGFSFQNNVLLETPSKSSESSELQIICVMMLQLLRHHQPGWQANEMVKCLGFPRHQSPAEPIPDTRYTPSHFVVDGLNAAKTLLQAHAERP